MPTSFALAARRTPVSLLAACLLALAGCGGGGGGGTGGGGGVITPPPGGGPTVTTSVSMTGLAFTPSAIQVSPGATLTFTNNDATNHNVTFDNNSATTIADFSTGSRTTIAPAAAGTYNYRCTIHAGMNGSVKVQ